jgi:cytochrome c2
MIDGRAAPALRLAAWHLAAVAVLLVWPAQFRAEWPIWKQPVAMMLQAVWGGLGYLMSALLVALAESSLRERSMFTRVCSVLLASALGFGVFLAVPALVAGVPFSRSLHLLAASAGTMLLLVPAVLREVPLLLPAVPLAALVLTIRQGAALAASDDFRLDTQYYLLSVKVQRPEPFDADTIVEGGGLARLGDDLLFVTGSGRFARLRRTDADAPWKVEPLPLPSPANPEDFARAAIPGVTRNWFRVVDLLADVRGDSVAILVTHHHWDVAANCFTLRVSESRADRALRAWTPWRTRFDAQPCLPFKVDERGLPFGGSASGGRMLRIGGGVLVTVGDEQFDGLNSRMNLPQDPVSHYGKTVLIGDDGSVRIHSLGHRNPQGLARDASGRVWATEHGPQGGDELNLIEAGVNYGWPYRTTGTEYGLRRWPLLREPDTQWREPAYSFVPSPGLSSLVAPTSERLSEWRGDLLVGTLRVRELLRVRLDQGRPVYVEELRIGYEVRDLEEAADGALVAWTDQGVLLSISPDGAERSGEALAAQCVGCHTLNAGQRGALGPNLSGIVGRRVASSADYAYSTALRDLGGRWTRERLDAYLAAPARFAPGTTMTFPGLADPAQRTVLIDYLQAGRER